MFNLCGNIFDMKYGFIMNSLQEASKKNKLKEKEVNVAYGMLIRYMHTSSMDKIFVLRLIIPTKINTDVKQLREVNGLAG